MHAAWIDPSLPLRFTTTLLHFLWQGCAIGALVVVGDLFLQRAPARWRYVLNVTALLLMAACLPATFALLYGPDMSPSAAHERQPATALTAAAPILDVEPQPHAFAGGEQLTVEPVPAEAHGGFGRESEPLVGPKSDAVTLFAPLFTAVYFVGVALMLIRMAVGLRGGHRLRRTAIPINDDSLLAAIRRQAHQLGLRCVPETAWCREISIPVVVGVLHPMVLLPAALATGLSPDQMRALITHELAHIRRYDPLVNMLQRLIEALLFFHPAVWFVSRRVNLERENATDDLVLSAGWRPPQYADALLRMAELSSALRKAGLAHQAATLAASGTNPSDFKRRLMRLVDGPEPISFRVTRSGLAALAIALVVSLSVPVAMHALADAPTDEQPEEERTQPAAAPADESPAAAIIDRKLLPIVADNFHQETRILGGLVIGGGIIERVERDTIYFRSGDRIEVSRETRLVLPAVSGQPLRGMELKPQLLEPGMAVSYSMRDGKIEKVVMTGIVAVPPPREPAFELIRKLDLRRGNETNTSLAGQFPMRITGKDGPVQITIGTTKLIKLPAPTMTVEWRIGDNQPEGIEDFEPFDYLLVQWRDNGRVTCTCYQSPPIAGANEPERPPTPPPSDGAGPEVEKRDGEFEQVPSSQATSDVERDAGRRDEHRHQTPGFPTPGGARLSDAVVPEQLDLGARVDVRNMDELLRDWADAMRIRSDIEIRFRRYVYDTAKRLESRTNGRIYFEDNRHGVLEATRVETDGVSSKAAPDGARYQLQSGESTTWFWDGDTLHVVDPDLRLFESWKVPASAGRRIGFLPVSHGFFPEDALHGIVGVDAEQFAESFHLAIERREPDHGIRLTAVPIHETDRRELEQLEILIDEETCRTRAVRMVSPSTQTETVFVLEYERVDPHQKWRPDLKRLAKAPATGGADEKPTRERSDSERARDLVDKARSDIRNADDAETDADRAALREDARRLIATARTLYEATLKHHETAFQKFPLVIPEADKVRRRKRAAAEQRYLQSKLDLAKIVYDEAQTWEHGSEQRKQVLQNALNGFQEIHQAHRAQVVGLVARLWEGKCLEGMNKIPEALGVLAELVEYSGTSDSLKVLQSHALQCRLICLNHESRRDYRLVIEEGERWREQAGAATQTDVGLGILFEVARAQELLGRDQTIPEAERIEYLKQARENAQVIARHQGELQAPARALIERVTARRSQ